MLLNLERILGQMMDAGIAPDVVTFNTLAKAFADSRPAMPEAAEQLLDRMTQCGVAADAVTYGSIANACSRSGQFWGALRALRLMEQEGIAPNVVVLSTVLTAAVRDGR